MKPRKPSVSYFPVDPGEQSLLLRVRESDLAGRTSDVLEMVDQLATAHLTPADLEIAIGLLHESRQGEGMEARFDNLEARLKERVEKGLAEIEGRLSKRVSEDLDPIWRAPVMPAIDAPEVPVSEEVPKGASLAVRIGPDLVWGPTASQFYAAVWRWLFENGRVRLADLPIAQRKRYVVATAPLHPTGKAFYRSEEVVPGVFVEMNMSRENIISRIRQILGQFGVAYEMVVGPES